MDDAADDRANAKGAMPQSSWEAQALSWTQHVQDADSVAVMAARLAELLPWPVAVFFRAYRREGLLRPVWSKGCTGVLHDDLRLSLQSPDSLAAHCCVTQNPIVLTSDTEFASWRVNPTERRAYADLGLRTVAAIPLLGVDGPVGALLVGGNAPGIEGDGQWRAIEALGAVVAGVIHRQMLLEELERQNRIMIATRELAEETVFDTDEVSLWSAFRDFLCKECGIDGGTYTRYDGGQWRLQEAFGVLRPYSARLQVDIPLWLHARAVNAMASDTRLLWTPDGVRPLPPYVETRSTLGHGLLYVIPGRDEPLAAVTLYAHDLDAAARHAVPSVLHTLAMSMRLVQQRTRLAYLSEHDGLTGLLNRAGFELAMEAAFAVSPNRMGIFAILDLDHFKEINDTYGHQRGDECLI
ncbi:MAG: GGDEF domain-containing protein, partial [Firmicutes bacterium]|nr:GGDEF domain-containing protein [Bacillota bacterium]